MTRTFTIVSGVHCVEAYVEDFLRSIEAQTIGLERIQVILVDDGSPDHSSDIIRRWCNRYPGTFCLLRKPNGGVATARNLGLEYVTGDWVTFADPDDVLHQDYFQAFDRFLDEYGDDRFVALLGRPIFSIEPSGQLDDSHPLRERFAEGNQVRDLPNLGGLVNHSVSYALLNARELLATGIRFDARVVPTFEDAHFYGRFLASVKGSVGAVSQAHYHYRKREDRSSLVDSSWTKRSKFIDTPRFGYLGLLREVKELCGEVPLWAQQMVLYDLQWFFREDAKMLSATRWLSEADQDTFHGIVAEIFEYIDEEVVWNFAIASPSITITHALLSYKRPVDQSPTVSLGRHDEQQRLLDIRYVYHGEPPDFRILVGGRSIAPVASKRQAVPYFGRSLFHKQIAWIELPEGKADVQVLLDGRPAPLVVGGLWTPDDSRDPADRVPLAKLRRRQRAPGGRRSMGRPSDLTTGERFLRSIAAWRPIADHYRGSWLFVDRDVQADDNAEHLYRWVLENRPEVPAFFLLRRHSHDWNRLQRDGFRLIPIGSLRWKLAILNADHVISSHLDDYIVNPLPLQRFGDLMRWRFTFLQHGVTQNDISAWLNRKFIDRMVTSTPAEQASIVADGSPYKQTEREVRRTGMARHDTLLRRAQASVSPPSKLLLMPTWRRQLVGRQIGRGNAREQADSFYTSPFAREWKAVLHDEVLLKLAAEHQLLVTFMPHLNMQPYLDWFSAPVEIEVLEDSEASMQEAFADTALLVTDYSSVAFDLALLRRPIVYFQFDRQEFFGGAHLWRPGYFDYERDGFGPVAKTLPELRSAISAALRYEHPSDPYLGRMARAFPERDGLNRQRIFDSILQLAEARSGLPRAEATPTIQGAG